MFRTEKYGFIVFVLLAIFVGYADIVEAQEGYPNRAINIIVPFTPGGSTDMMARMMGPFLSKKWNVPVNVINKPGGNTVPGQMEVYNSPADGYTMLADGLPMCSLLEVVVRDLPFKVMDRSFISMIVYVPIITIVPSNSAHKTLSDLMAEARKDPENFTWDSLGGSSGNDVVGRMFFKAAGVDVSKTKPVMSKGGSAAATLVAGGHIKMGHPSIISAWPHIQGGTVRILAVATKKRDPSLPDVPSTSELGYPTIDGPMWNGISGPPKLPSHIVDVWDQAVKEMLTDPEYLSQFRKLFLRPFYHSPTEMKDYVRKESETLADLYGVKKR
jgi:tripartite-type tricarboxylate transporter receptor subunit TctC